jgi:hypothetical protein
MLAVNTGGTGAYNYQWFQGTPPGAAIGGASGLAAKKAIEGADGLQRTAEDLAFSAIGGRGTKAGKALITQDVQKMLDPDLPEKSLFTSRDVGRKLLDEDLFDPEKVGKAGRAARQDIESLLTQVEGTKPSQEVSTTIQKEVLKEEPFTETKTGKKDLFATIT